MTMVVALRISNSECSVKRQEPSDNIALGDKKYFRLIRTSFVLSGPVEPEVHHVHVSQRLLQACHPKVVVTFLSFLVIFT